ncbi:hypothetical protein [Tistlia consotensis]|uniref:hypothetical protein n=1 Tax=Tistlia consotensis TaxID=1321365 RepID=UPI00117E55D7|nr:hypothetical protein [Tistlia consotensis]
MAYEDALYAIHQRFPPTFSLGPRVKLATATTGEENQHIALEAAFKAHHIVRHPETAGEKSEVSCNAIFSSPILRHGSTNLL